MAGQIWFGTKDYATWVPAPSVSNYASGAQNWSSKVSFLNGGANVRRSFGSHKEYSMSWAPTAHHKVNPIMDFAQGMYGDGLIYWSDPFAEYTNVLPKDLATPYLSGLDGVKLTSDNQVPVLVPTSANSYGFPVKSAQYTNIPGNFTNRRFYVPIPPGYDFVMRAWGTETGTLRYWTLANDGTAGSVPWSTVDDISNNTNVRRYAGGALGSGVEIYLHGSAGNSGTVTGAMAQIVPAGSTPRFERFISGQGNSGCRFEGMPATSPYSAAMDLVGMTANLVEVGAWL